MSIELACFQEGPYSCLTTSWKVLCEFPVVVRFHSPLTCRLWSFRTEGSNKEDGGGMNGFALSGGTDQDARYHTGGKLTVQRGETFFRAAELMNSGSFRSAVVCGGLSQSTRSVSSQLNTYNWGSGDVRWKIFLRFAHAGPKMQLSKKESMIYQ